MYQQQQQQQQQQQLLQHMNRMNGLSMMNGGHQQQQNHAHAMNNLNNLNLLNNAMNGTTNNTANNQRIGMNMRRGGNKRKHAHRTHHKRHTANNNSGSVGAITYYDLQTESGIKNRLPNLRYHVFISKETTRELSDYILPEAWGEENGLLYKYLDYVWRCQLFDCQIKKFCCRNECKLVFHSGLQRRSDGEFVYLLLIANDADESRQKVDQKWRVALGIQNGLHSRNMSFVTRQELLKHYWPNTDCGGDRLPQRTLFYSTEKDLIFNRHYRFEIDWEERLRTCKNRIYKALRIDESVLPLSELQRRFCTQTSKSILLCRGNPRIGVPQAFIESKNGGYRLELLIPLSLYFANKYFYFALALRPHHDEQIYEGMSILTREMAYANARLVGRIDSSWLKHTPPNHSSCDCTCHAFCDQRINPMTIHNVADHKRKYQNDIPHDRSKPNTTPNIIPPQTNPQLLLQNLYNQNNTQNRIYQPQPPQQNNPFQMINNPYMAAQAAAANNQFNLSSILRNPAFITSVPNNNNTTHLALPAFINTHTMNTTTALASAYLPATQITTFGPLTHNMPISSSGSQLGGASLPNYQINKPPVLMQATPFGSNSYNNPYNNSISNPTQCSSTTSSAKLSARNTKIGKIEENSAAEKDEEEDDQSARDEPSPNTECAAANAAPIEEETVDDVSNTTEAKPAPKVVPSISIPITKDESGEEGDDEDNDKTGESRDEPGGFTEDMFADASPRTKEVFSGLRFDVDDDYSLDHSNKSSDKKGSMSRAKSFAYFFITIKEEQFIYTHDGTIHRTQLEHRIAASQHQSHRVNFNHVWYGPTAPVVPLSQQYNDYYSHEPPHAPPPPQHDPYGKRRMTKSHSQPLITYRLHNIILGIPPLKSIYHILTLNLYQKALTDTTCHSLIKILSGNNPIAWSSDMDYLQALQQLTSHSMSTTTRNNDRLKILVNIAKNNTI
eukprot:222600_1